MSTLVRVRLKTRMAGPLGNYGKGEEIIVDEKLAESLVASGSAEKIEVIKEVKETKKQVETAMVDPASEKAVIPNSKPRTGSAEKKRVTKGAYK